MNSYGAVTERAQPVAEWRCTAYWWAAHHDLPTSLGHLFELGARAARLARWYGVRQAMVWEGFPDGSSGFWVHQWPEAIWREAEAAAGAGVPCSPAPAQPPPPPPPPPPPATRVVNCQREPYQVYIGRPGPWGNPFVIGRDGDRATVIAKHAAWIVQQPALMARLGELRGRVLGCHCAPEPCHGDVLAALADGRPLPQTPLPAPYARPDSPLPGASGEPRWTAWQYAEKARVLTGECDDPDFVSALDRYATWIAYRRGLPQVQAAIGGGYLANTWPEPLWSGVLDAMAQRGAESGDWHLDDMELDAVADGFLPDPEYRPGGKPSPAQFMAHYDDGSPGNENSFWSYPPPPQDTQAYVDWERMADGADREYGPWVNANYESDCDGCSSRIQAGDVIRADGRGGWLCAICGDEDAREAPYRDVPYESRDAGWGEGGVPWDGDDINHSAWDPGWPPQSSEDM